MYIQIYCLYICLHIYLYIYCLYIQNIYIVYIYIVYIYSDINIPEKGDYKVSDTLIFYKQNTDNKVEIRGLFLKLFTYLFTCIVR